MRTEIMINGVRFNSMYKACEAHKASRNKVRKYMLEHPEAKAGDVVLLFAGKIQKPSWIRRCETLLPDEVIGFRGNYYEIPTSTALCKDQFTSFARMCRHAGIKIDADTFMTYLEAGYRLEVSMKPIDDKRWKKVPQNTVDRIWKYASHLSSYLTDRHKIAQLQKIVADRLIEEKKNGYRCTIENAMDTLLNTGVSIDEAIESTKVAREDGFEYAGKMYYGATGVEACAAEHNVNVSITPSVALSRILSGMPVEEAIVLQPKSGRDLLPPVTPQMWGWNDELHVFVAPNGKHYKSRAAMAMDYGWPAPNTVTRRLAYGLSLSEALNRSEKLKTTAYVSDPKFKCEAFGYSSDLQGYTLDGVKVYPTYKQMCKENGISAIAWRVVCEHRWDKEWLLENRNVFSQPVVYPYCEHSVSLTTACQKYAVNGKHIGTQTVIAYACKHKITSLQIAFNAVAGIPNYQE